MLLGSANMDYIKEGDKGLIAAPEDVHKTCSQMFMKYCMFRMFLNVHPDARILQYQTIMILLLVQCAWISEYATWFCKHGLYQRRGQGAYCRPGGGPQNMFIDVDEMLHMCMMFLNVHPDTIILQY